MKSYSTLFWDEEAELASKKTDDEPSSKFGLGSLRMPWRRGLYSMRTV